MPPRMAPISPKNPPMMPPPNPMSRHKTEEYGSNDEDDSQNDEGFQTTVIVVLRGWGVLVFQNLCVEGVWIHRLACHAQSVFWCHCLGYHEPEDDVQNETETF